MTHSFAVTPVSGHYRKEMDAIMAAYEMYITSPQFEEKLWRRLVAISVENVGFGEPMAPVLINSLNQMRKEFIYADGDRPLFFVHAIRYLCRCKKDRSSDHLKNITIHKFESGEKPEIPSYALDMHTVRGRAMGRDMLHFLTEASRVEPELECEEFKRLHEQYMQLLQNTDIKTSYKKSTPEYGIEKRKK
jgi:hypothetical protein